MQIKLLLFVLFVLNMGLFAQNQTDEAFLDALRNETGYAPQFKAHMLFEVSKPGGAPSSATFTLYENDGQSIALFLSPPRDKGKAILQIESKYWIYFPKAKRATVLSPMANMVGNASNGDVLRPPEGTLYDITILDIEPKVGNRVVQFIASSRLSPYGKIISYYENDKILESEMYSRSGILLKKAYYYEHMKNTRGFGWLPTKSRIVDGTNEEIYTDITFTDVEILSSVNQSWFNPHNLGRVRK